MSFVRVVVADDSQIAVQRIEQVLAGQLRLQVVATVHSVQELMTAVQALAPDVVTLDLLMPGRTGLAVIRQLSTSTSVVVVSDHDQDSMLAQEALAQGAMSFVEKRALGTEAGRAGLVRAVMRVPRVRAGKARQNIIAIAGSTGGIPALEAFAKELSTVDAAVAVVQHLPAPRMGEFASWLSTQGLRTVVVRGGEILQTGCAYIAPGDRHLRIERGVRAKLDDSPPVKGHKPSATVLFESLVDRAKDVVVVVLSGMGDDGAAGLSTLAAAGARCIVQKRDTCAVPGMPDAALLASGARGRSLPPREIGAALRSLLGAAND